MMAQPQSHSFIHLFIYLDKNEGTLCAHPKSKNWKNLTVDTIEVNQGVNKDVDGIACIVNCILWFGGSEGPERLPAVSFGDKSNP